jgi:arabinose-5-phosphate isomerase
MSVTDEKIMLTSFNAAQAGRALELAREALDVEGEAIRKLAERLGRDSGA